MNTSLGTVTLKINLVKEYPMVLPIMEITSTSHKLITHDLMKDLKEEVKREWKEEMASLNFHF